VIFRQFLHQDPVGASYLLGCGGHAICAVVDPVEDIAPYLQTAADTHMAIRYVFDTHVHADHVSGGRTLAEQAGATYLLHESAGAGRAAGVASGQHIEMGNVVVEVLHTPGHTPEHMSLLVTDKTRGPEPWMILTGHTLMVGDMGRTELASRADEGAALLFDSAQRLRQLRDHVEVWPGAFAGSVCGRALSGKAASTIGFERAFNRTFRIEDRDTFVAAMLREIPEPPANAAAIRARNLAG
jgi:hydroxyacylglutathione hydrolase